MILKTTMTTWQIQKVATKFCNWKFDLLTQKVMPHFKNFKFSIALINCTMLHKLYVIITTSTFAVWFEFKMNFWIIKGTFPPLSKMGRVHRKPLWQVSDHEKEPISPNSMVNYHIIYPKPFKTVNSRRNSNFWAKKFQRNIARETPISIQIGDW